MKVQLSVFATAALASGTHGQETTVPPPPPSYLSLDAYGTPLEISDTPIEYDQNQNHAGGVDPTISADHLSLTTTGNRWSAYALPSTQEVFENSVLKFTFALDAATDDGFQAICVDADTEKTGSNGQCFVLATTQGWINNMLNVAQMTNVGETTEHSIPIGHFFTGSINYISFLQDSDGTDRSLGSSTFSNLMLVQEDRNKLSVEINSAVSELTNEQLSYKKSGGNQDTEDWVMAISEDGSSAQLNGNQWKALALNEPYNMTHYTILEFDIVVTEPADFHSICLDDNLDAEGSGGDTCVSFFTPRDNFFHMLTTELTALETKHLVLPFGQIMNFLDGDSKEVNYLAFIQDNDQADGRAGRSTYSNIRLYEEDRMNISIDVFGETVTIPNIQDSFTATSGSTVQDSIDHVMSVSTDGSKVTAYGNSWKRFKLDTPIDVDPTTVLKFTFEVPHEAEGHGICLLGDTDNARDGRDDCYWTAGLDVKSSDTSFKKIDPKTPEGQTMEYTIWIGSYFTGPVHYLAFSVDNDKVYTETKAEGESSWSNIEIYNLPSLNIGLDNSIMALQNNQVSYDSNQDTTPVRDNLATVSDDGSSVTISGNMWRAFPVPTKTSAELGDFVVSFDYVLNEPGEIHAICFDDNLVLGDYDDPNDNEYDPKRCFRMNLFQTDSNHVWFTGYEPVVGETHHYALNLSKMFDRFYEVNYFVLISDNDIGDKSGGEFVVSNIQITTSLTSCLKDAPSNLSFQLSSCTTANFLDAVKTEMNGQGCSVDKDPLLELMALFDVKNEMEVYKEIEYICNSSYEPSEYDFTKAISSETQIVKEFIDGGTMLNYENDSEGGNLLKDGAGISNSNDYTTSHLLTWPKHHALDHCDVGAAMCCWVDNRGDTALEDNTDVCYVDMHASKRTAHVADGFSIYGDSQEGAVNCHGFAWGTDNGSIASALKGNALFKVGFMDSLYTNGNVEQVPGAPMCGCMDRMPVVTEAACTKVSDNTAKVDITYNKELGLFTSKFNMGTIEFATCDDNDGSPTDLNTYYKKLVGDDSPSAAYMDTRLVGAGNCAGAISDFIYGKGLLKSA